MNITAKDIGRKVRLRNGEIVTIEDVDLREHYPVLAGDEVYTTTGKYDLIEPYYAWDIVAFEDEPEEENMEEWKSLDELMEGIKPGEKTFVGKYGQIFTPFFKTKTFWYGLGKDMHAKTWENKLEYWKPYVPEKKTKKVTMYRPVFKSRCGYSSTNIMHSTKEAFASVYVHEGDEIVGWIEQEAEVWDEG